jgi:hypothetical protein
VIGDQVGSPDATKHLGSLPGNRNSYATRPLRLVAFRADPPPPSSSRRWRRALPARVGLAKAHRIKTSGGPMSGIYMILVFVAVMAILNKVEFGRFD